MNKFTLLASTLLFSIPGFAQFSLNYETHCYQTNQAYDYHLVEYKAPGNAGEHCVWDFSGLKETEVMEGEISTDFSGFQNAAFSESSISIVENGTTFFYENTPNEMLLVGYISSDNKTVTTYTKPFIKLKFPFSFGNSYDGEVVLKHLNSEYTKNGTYTVTADAYGSLELPNGQSFNEALRVKSVITYALSTGDKQVQEIYRWYVEGVPFPVMVLQDIQYVMNTGKITHTYKAAYNKSTALSLQQTKEIVFQISPNPNAGNFNIQFQPQASLQLSLDIYNVEGKQMERLFYGNPENLETAYSLNRSKYQAGIYFIKITQGKTTFTQQLLIQD